MRRVSKLISSLLLLFVILVSLPLPVDAAAYKTYSQAPSGDLVETQTAYEAYDILYSNQMTSPEDIVIKESTIYIVDSQQRQVLIMDINGEVLNSFGEDVLSGPTGIALDSENNIYVADGSAARVFKFAEDGELLAEFAKPEEPLFGTSSPFTPRKITVDIRGNMYIVGEGATAGIIQLNPDGEFLGYFGANEAPTNFLQVIRDNLLSEIQQARVFRNVPPASSNIDIDNKGIVYTVTSTAQSEIIKKLNVAGANMLGRDVYQPTGAVDVAAGLYNNFYVLTDQGQIVEYSNHGGILFRFGQRDSGSQRLGVYNNPSAIGVDEFGTLYVVDSEAQLIHKLRTTEFADEIHSGLILYEDGRYMDSEEYWQNVINMNPSFGMARFALGESYFQRQEYGRALSSFRTAEAVPAYSNAFWEIRNDWFQRNLGMVLFAIILFFIALKIVNVLTRRKYGKTPWRMLRERSRRSKTARELGYVFRMFRHPFDTLYEIQNMNKSSVKSASILYGVLLIQFILFNYFTGFIFNYRLVDTYNIVMLVMIFILTFALLISMNYMIATITEGEGSFKDVYMGVAYSFAPVLVGIIPVILLSNILTLNEAFLFQFPIQVMLVYTAVHLVIMIKEMHDFESWKIVQNILLTLFAALVTVIVLYIMYILFINLYDFIYSLILEVSARV
ncbi:YIP1 family protein [Alkalibacterium sp. f15]|uniref:YIP1 family protein n=1 Tax=Alkalibacterium sp. f15 TaxID=3414029 RepID=UPI003BF9116D